MKNIWLDYERSAIFFLSQSSWNWMLDMMTNPVLASCIWSSDARHTLSVKSMHFCASFEIMMI